MDPGGTENGEHVRVSVCEQERQQEQVSPTTELGTSLCCVSAGQGVLCVGGSCSHAPPLHHSAHAGDYVYLHLCLIYLGALRSWHMGDAE